MVISFRDYMLVGALLRAGKKFVKLTKDGICWKLLKDGALGLREPRSFIWLEVVKQRICVDREWGETRFSEVANFMGLMFGRSYVVLGFAEAGWGYLCVARRIARRAGRRASCICGYCIRRARLKVKSCGGGAGKVLMASSPSRPCLPTVCDFLT